MSNLKKCFSMLLFALAVSGCTAAQLREMADSRTTSSPIVGPDGTKNQLLKCPMMVESCYAKATDLCSGPYKIINSNSNSDKDGTIFNFLIKCGV